MIRAPYMEAPPIVLRTFGRSAVDAHEDNSFVVAFASGSKPNIISMNCYMSDLDQDIRNTKHHLAFRRRPIVDPNGFLDIEENDARRAKMIK